MTGTSFRKARTLRSCRFVPLRDLQSPDPLLEPRVSATGLFWSPPASTDSSLVQAAILTGSTLLSHSSSSDVNTTSNNYATYTASSATVTGDDGFGDYAYMTGTGTAQIIDNGPSANSGAPVSSASVGQVVTDKIEMCAPSSNPWYGSASVQVESQSSAYSSYLLADDGTGSPSTDLTEHFCVHYTAPANKVYTDTSSAWGGSTSGFTWQLSPGYASLNSYYSLTPNSSGTIYPSNGATITYTFTVASGLDPNTELNVTVVTPISDLSPDFTTLPTQSDDVSTMVGFQYDVENHIDLNLSGEPPYGTTDQACMTVKYSAHM